MNSSLVAAPRASESRNRKLTFFPKRITKLWTQWASLFRRQNQPCYSKVKMLLKYVGLIIVMCAVLNMATLASIGYHVSVRQRTVTSVFNTSMHLYVTTESYKFNLDQIQIGFQCCGHTSYADWFFFDWQVKINSIGTYIHVKL